MGRKEKGRREKHYKVPCDARGWYVMKDLQKKDYLLSRNSGTIFEIEEWVA